MNNELSPAVAVLPIDGDKGCGSFAKASDDWLKPNSIVSNSVAAEESQTAKLPVLFTMYLS